MVEPNVIVAMSGAVGAVLYMLYKYMDKKKADPTLMFDYTYLLSTLTAAVGVFMTYQNVVITEVDPFMLVEALMVGFAYSAGAATVNSKIPFQLVNTAGTASINTDAEIKK